MRKIRHPEMLKGLPDNAQLRGEEVVKLFGYSERGNMSQLLRAKSIPKPTHNCSGFSRNKNFGWEVKYLRGFL